MASNFKKSETILIPFRDGWSISDSQGKPRIYKTRNAFERSFPKHYLGTDGVELVEYAEVRHGQWRDLRESHKDVPHIRCTWCSIVIYGLESKYCPNCGAKMDLEVQ